MVKIPSKATLNPGAQQIKERNITKYYRGGRVVGGSGLLTYTKPVITWMVLKGEPWTRT